MRTFERPVLSTLVRRLREPRRHLQVLAGPRQVGKSTLAAQAVDRLGLPTVSVSADGVAPEDAPWIETHWVRARQAARSAGSRGALLVLDEVQKVRSWSESVKRFWDEDTRARLPLKVLLLGSSPLLVQKGLTESLAGRFEILRATHWSWAEMRDAFGWDVETYVRLGGYPGAAPLAGDPLRWTHYVLDSLVETTLSRDVLLLTRVDKPALLRRLFELGCAYSGQVLSYTKMLGQLHDAGNTTTLAHYLDLLSGAGLLTGLSKYAGQHVRRRASSPKLLALDTALLTAVSGRATDDGDAEFRGRQVETAVGAHLVNTSTGSGVDVFYWSEGAREVDFVLREGRTLCAVEVKSGRRRSALPGLGAFEEAFRPQRRLLVGTGGVPLEAFLARPAAEWVRG